MNKATLQQIVSIINYMVENNEFTVTELHIGTKIEKSLLHSWLKFFHQSRYIKRGNYKFTPYGKQRLWVVDCFPIKGFTCKT